MNFREGLQAAKATGASAVSKLVYLLPLLIVALILISGLLFTRMIVEGKDYVPILRGVPVPIDSLVVKSSAFSTDTSSWKATVDTLAYKRGVTLSSRQIWAALANVHVVTCLIVLVIVAFIANRIMREDPQPGTPWGRFLLGSGMVLGPLAVIAAFGSAGDLPSMTNDFVRLTIRHEFAGAETVVSALDGLTFATAITIAMTAGVIIASVVFARNVDGPLLDRRFTQVQVLLYCSSAVLVTHLFQVNEIHNWVLDYFPNSKQPGTKNIHAIIVSAMNTRALYQTLCVAAVYIPSIVFIKRQMVPALSAAKEATDAPKVAASSFNLGDLVPRTLALIAPLMTGPLVELLRLLFAGSGS